MITSQRVLIYKMQVTFFYPLERMSTQNALFILCYINVYIYWKLFLSFLSFFFWGDFWTGIHPIFFQTGKWLCPFSTYFPCSSPSILLCIHFTSVQFVYVFNTQKESCIKLLTWISLHPPIHPSIPPSIDLMHIYMVIAHGHGRLLWLSINLCTVLCSVSVIMCG